jgi:hypothetical protein
MYPWLCIALFSGELFLAYGAEGALEIFGYILPLGAGGDTAFGIAFSLVVFPAAKVTNIFHKNYLLGF